MASNESLFENDNHGLIASVAYALWEERKRRNAPDDPEADWFTAEELVAELETHGQLAAD